MWLKENPSPKVATGDSGILNPAAFQGQRRRNSATGSAYLGGFPCDAWSSAWQHTSSQPCVLISFMAVGSINQHFSLQLPQNPSVRQAQCQGITQLLSYRVFFPPAFHRCSEQQSWDTGHPWSLTACVLGMIWGDLFQHKWFHDFEWRNVIVQLIQAVTAHHIPRTPVHWG